MNKLRFEDEKTDEFMLRLRLYRVVKRLVERSYMSQMWTH